MQYPIGVPVDPAEPDAGRDAVRCVCRQVRAKEITAEARKEKGGPERDGSTAVVSFHCIEG
jgi:hypothetical protein